MNPELYALPLYIASLVGSIAFALSGFLVGVRKELDLMGLFILAFLTANGGGVVRDVLLSRPLALVQDAEPFFIAGGVLLVASMLRLHRLQQLENRWYVVVSDSIGLVAFGMTGAMIGMEAQTHFFGVLSLSLLTAVGGGVLRDILVNEKPVVLHSGFYGTVALVQATVLFVLQQLQWLTPVSLLLVACAALALRLVAFTRRWSIPKLRWE